MQPILSVADGPPRVRGASSRFSQGTPAARSSGRTRPSLSRDHGPQRSPAMAERQTSNDRADLGVQAPMDGQDAKNQDLQPNREHPDGTTLTTNQGVNVAENQNSLKA